VENLERLLEQLIQSGKAPPALMQTMAEAQNDPAKLASLLEHLRTLAGPAAQDTLNILDYYREGNGHRYTLRWPLPPGNLLHAKHISFDSLDRKTQFFTLFTDWQRRETEGMLSLTAGALVEAETVFSECVERARQIDVGELVARSYEDLARVAERRGDQNGVRAHLDNAEAARATG